MSNKMRIMSYIAPPSWRDPEFMDDLVEMCQRGQVTDVAILMMGIPECDEDHQGVRQAVEQFGRIKARLEPHGVRAGISVPVLLGHGERSWPVPNVPYQRIVGWDGTESPNCFCPLDEGFLDHVRQVIHLMAQAEPAFMLIDDDVRLQNHYPARWSCACPLHVEYFNRTTGHNLSRQEIFQLMRGDSASAQEIKDQWFGSGEKTLLTLAGVIRSAIDRADPSIRCGKCASGGRNILLQEPIARALAGTTRPLIRIANGFYGHPGYKQFGDVMASHQAQRSLMGDDIEFMCEADTYPHVRYSTALRTMRGFIAGALLASKVDLPLAWLPCWWDWIRSEWEAYADTMGQSEPFFRALRDLSRKTRWIGPASICLRTYNCVPDPSDMPPRESRNDMAWGGLICGMMGIPFTVNRMDASVAMIDGTSAQVLTDGEMERFLSGGLLLDGPAALAFARRGHADRLGVEVELPDTRLGVSDEVMDDDPINGTSSGMHMGTLLRRPSMAMRLKMRGARAVSWFTRCRHYNDLRFERILPSVTLFENKMGGRIAVYTHDVAATDFMSFLSPVRKQQLIGVLEWLGRGALPAVAMTPADTYMLFGQNDADKEAVAALFNLCPDPIEAREGVPIRLAGPTPRSILKLEDSGDWRELGFTPTADGIRLSCALDVMWPLVLRIRT